MITPLISPIASPLATRLLAGGVIGRPPAPTGFVVLRQPDGSPIKQPNGASIYTPLQP